MQSRELDVLVVGGGLVGGSLALALARCGVGVVLVDIPSPAPGMASDPRKLALSAASLSALGALGVLARLPGPPTPIRRIHASRAGDFGRVVLEAAELGREALGGVVLAGDLARALGDAVAAAGVPTVRGRADADGVEEGARRAVVRGADGEAPWRARLVVAADGTGSPWRQAAGIDTDEYDYGQTLVVTSMRVDHRPDGTAWERLTDEGPCALLPMADGWHGALCGVASESVDAVAALDDAGYADYFQRRFGWRAGRIRAVGARSLWPLRRVMAQRLAAERLVLVGNAAQTLHPIGAQGFNLGLRDALTIAELIGDARATDAAADPGDAALLREHEARRRVDREATLAFSDGLARFSAGGSFIHHALRSVGLLALAADPGLRATIAAGAMGFRGHVPALAREVA